MDIKSQPLSNNDFSITAGLINDYSPVIDLNDPDIIKGLELDSSNHSKKTIRADNPNKHSTKIMITLRMLTHPTEYNLQNYITPSIPLHYYYHQV